MLAVIVSAASANAFRRLGFLSDVSRGAAVCGFLPADGFEDGPRLKALTGREPRVRRMKDGRIRIECYEGHLEGIRRFAELADAIERWLEETGRR
jgi:hypothetical protein